LTVLAAHVRPLVLNAARWAGLGARSVPGAGGALLVSYGVWQVYAPAGAIVAGLFLLALDRTLR
jgi:hypothetical protein